jgi:hypothetical protein
MKIPVECYTTDSNVRILTKECPNGMSCKVGSILCARCPNYQKRDMGFVYCKAGRKRREAVSEANNKAVA